MAKLNGDSRLGWIRNFEPRLERKAFEPKGDCLNLIVDEDRILPQPPVEELRTILKTKQEERSKVKKLGTNNK